MATDTVSWSMVVSLASAATALVAVFVGPIVSYRVAARQINAEVISKSRQKWLEELRTLVAELLEKTTMVMWRESYATMSQVELFNERSKIIYLQSKVSLYLEPQNPFHAAMLREINRYVEIFSDYRTPGIPEQLEILKKAIIVSSAKVLNEAWEKSQRGA
jgi:hypothetical protein